MTTAPVRMRLSRAKGFNLQAASRAINGLPAVNCARPGRLGNPFTVQRALESGYLRRADDRTRRRFVVECFRDWLSGSDKWWMGEESAAARQAVLDCLPSLRDHNLACWCPMPELGGPDHCHAAVLLEIANRNWRLVELLKQAAQHKMTPEEIEAQRQSWVRGELALSEWERSVTKVSR